MNKLVKWGIALIIIGIIVFMLTAAAKYMYTQDHIIDITTKFTEVYNPSEDTKISKAQLAYVLEEGLDGYMEFNMLGTKMTLFSPLFLISFVVIQMGVVLIVSGIVMLILKNRKTSDEKIADRLKLQYLHNEINLDEYNEKIKTLNLNKDTKVGDINEQD